MEAIQFPLSKIRLLVEGRKKLLTEITAPLTVKDDTVTFKDVMAVDAFAKELDVPIKAVFESGERTDLDEGVKIGRGASAYKRTSERSGVPYYTYHHLVTTSDEPNLMALRVDLHAKDGMPVRFNAGHDSKEIVYVTRGRVRVDWTPAQRATRTEYLEQGDSIYIEPGVPHSFMAAAEATEIIAVNY